MPTIRFLKHDIIWQVDFCELAYVFSFIMLCTEFFAWIKYIYVGYVCGKHRECVNIFFFFVFLLLNGFLVPWLR